MILFFSSTMSNTLPKEGISVGLNRDSYDNLEIRR